jgi:Fe-S-cluster containining protein
MKLGVSIDMYPESWRKRAERGEMIGIPMPPIFSNYLSEQWEDNPGFAQHLLNEFMKAFRDTYNYLENFPVGAERARRIWRELGKIQSRSMLRRKQNGHPMPSCKANCSSCCHIRVVLMDSEADALVEHLRAHDIKLDRELVLYQKEHAVTDTMHSTMPYEKRRCPILGEDGNCRAYEARPAACRKYLVASDPKMCDMRYSDTAAIIMEPAVEAVVAALGSLEEPEDKTNTNMPSRLLERIPEDDRLWK